MCRMINNTTNATLNAVLRIKPEAEILTSDAMRTIIEDARRSEQGAATGAAAAAMKLFDRLFRYARPDSRWGWQLVAVARFPG